MTAYSQRRHDPKKLTIRADGYPIFGWTNSRLRALVADLLLQKIGLEETIRGEELATQPNETTGSLGASAIRMAIAFV